MLKVPGFSYSQPLFVTLHFRGHLFCHNHDRSPIFLVSKVLTIYFLLNPYVQFLYILIIARMSKHYSHRKVPYTYPIPDTYYLPYTPPGNPSHCELHAQMDCITFSMKINHRYLILIILILTMNSIKMLSQYNFDHDFSLSRRGFPKFSFSVGKSDLSKSTFHGRLSET